MRQLKHFILIIAVLGCALSCSKTDDPVPTPTPPVATPVIPVVPPPTSSMAITSISPNYGKAGTEIIITGAKFSATIAENTVKLGGVSATVTAATTTQLKINAPADATHGTIQVKVGTDSVISETYYYEPIVTSLNVTSGKEGDIVIITGKHFATSITDLEVKFNTTLAEIIAATSTTLSVRVPIGATAGFLSVARKTKAPVNGPNFTITAPGGPSTTAGFTIINGSVSITKLLTEDGGYGQILCMTIDEDRNIAYAASREQIIKIDLATNSVSPIINTASFLNIPNGQPSAMDVDASGKLYVYGSMYGLIPPTGSNVFIIDPVAKTAKIAGNRFLGYTLVGNLGLNTPFVVLGNGDIITFDQTNRQLCKFSSDLSVRTVIYTMPLALESFIQLIKVNNNTVRIVLTGLSSKYYYDYSGALGLKTDFNAPAGFNMISQTIGGNSKYGVAGTKIEDPSNAFSGQPRTTYTVGRLNAAQTGWEKSGSFIIETLNQVSTIKFYNFIGLNGKNYFYADKNGNMYVNILGSSLAETGIYKISLN